MSRLRVPAGARWSCQASGFCCRMFALGPLDDETWDRLRRLDPASWWPPAADGPIAVERPGPDGRPARFLRKIDGACLFLGPDHRCAIHARFGEAAKPPFCRDYPVYVVQDGPDAFAAVPRADCLGLHASFDAGADFADEALVQLRRPGGRQVSRYLPEAVPLWGEHRVPRADWLAFEARALGALREADLQPGAGIALVRDLMASEFDLELPSPSAGHARLAARAVTAGVRMVLARALDSEAGARGFDAAFSRALLDRLQAADADADPPPLGRRSRAWFGLVLRSHLLGKLFRPLGSPVTGLGLALVGIRVAALGQPRDADGLVDHDAVGRAYAAWSRLTSNEAVLHLLRAARPALDDAFLHAG